MTGENWSRAMTVWASRPDLRAQYRHDASAFRRAWEAGTVEGSRQTAPAPAKPVASTAPGAPLPPPAAPPRPLEPAAVDEAIEAAWQNPTIRGRFGSRAELAALIRTGRGASSAPAPTSSAIDPSAPIEQRAEAEWRADPDLRSSFGGDDAESLRRYVAVRRAEERGRGGSVHRGDTVRVERSAS